MPFRLLTEVFREPRELPPSLAEAIGPSRFVSLVRAIGPRGGPRPAPSLSLPASSVPRRTVRDLSKSHLAGA